MQSYHVTERGPDDGFHQDGSEMWWNLVCSHPLGGYSQIFLMRPNGEFECAYCGSTSKIARRIAEETARGNSVVPVLRTV